MTDFAKWVSLWEKCPDLRPSTIEYVQVADMPLLNSIRLQGEIMEALIRDRAVWWLAERDILITRDETGDGLVWRIVSYKAISSCGGTTRGWFPEVFHPERTEALRLACCKVLGATP